MPKIERGYLLRPQLGKCPKSKNRNFAELEANLHKYVPGPKYNTMTDWNKDFPFNKGQFLKAPREVPEKVALKKERNTPSPSQYTQL